MIERSRSLRAAESSMLHANSELRLCTCSTPLQKHLVYKNRTTPRAGSEAAKDDARGGPWPLGAPSRSCLFQCFVSVFEVLNHEKCLVGRLQGAGSEGGGG